MRSLYNSLARLSLALTLLAAPVLAADQFVNVLTGGTSGAYYPLGVAFANAIGKELPDVKTSAQATKASVENLNLLQAGRGEIAFTLGDSLSDAWRGNEEAGFKSPLKKLRGIAAIYPNYIQIVARADTGIKTLADLKGKKISVGAPKSEHRAQRTRDPGCRRPLVQGVLQGRVPAVRRVGRVDEEPPARRDVAIGRSRGRLAQGSRNVDGHCRGRRSSRRGQEGQRPGLYAGNDSGQYLQWPDFAGSRRRGSELPRDARRPVSRHGLPHHQSALDLARSAGQCARCSQSDRPQATRSMACRYHSIRVPRSITARSASSSDARRSPPLQRAGRWMVARCHGSPTFDAHAAVTRIRRNRRQARAGRSCRQIVAGSGAAFLHVPAVHRCVFAAVRARSPAPCMSVSCCCSRI